MHTLVLIFKTLLPVLWAALMLVGCAGHGAGGRLELSTAVSRDFESGTLLPDHAYYTTGSEMNPDAVIAIDHRYTLVTDRWRAVAATEKLLKDWVDMITNFRGYGLRTLGSRIVGPQNEPIGVWYSSKSDFTTVRMLEDNRVMVYPPSDENLMWPRPLQILGVE